jgi:hypothetical protein
VQLFGGGNPISLLERKMIKKIGRDVEREQEQKTKRAQKRSSAEEVLAFLQRSCCCRYRCWFQNLQRTKG